MQCEDFLEDYSSFVDGRLDPADHTTFEAHLERCATCERYHRVVQRGLLVFRNLPELHPSPEFLPRLRHRLYHVDDGPRLAHASPVGSAALVAVAAVGVLALAWLPFATRLSVEVELPPVAVEAPVGEASMPSLFSRGPFLAPAGDGYAPGRVVPATAWLPPRAAPWRVSPATASWSASDPYAAFFRPRASAPSPAIPTASHAR